MDVFEVVFMAIGLGMDAFAVSICKGLSIKKSKIKKAIIIALYFGAFHIIMPIIGYFLGSAFEVFVNNVDHWIAFILLAIVGGNMIKESNEDDSEDKNSKIDIKTMIILSLAISIDSLAVGTKFGDKLKNKAKLTGGIILIIIGIKILLEHLGILVL